MVRLGARELRKQEPTEKELVQIKRNPIYLVLDNVLDTYNVGAIFRLADAVAAEKIYLCGQTEIPPNHKILKASVGTWKWVGWEYAPSAVEAITQLTSEVKKMPASQRGEQPHLGGVKTLQVVAIEQSKKSVRYGQLSYTLPICLVVGNETEGVSKEVLKMADGIVEIPMWGVNKSLNVMVALAIILYKVIEKV